MAFKKSWKRSGFVIYSHFKTFFGMKKVPNAFERDHMSIVVIFLSKMVYN